MESKITCNRPFQEGGFLRAKNRHGQTGERITTYGQQPKNQTSTTLSQTKQNHQHRQIAGKINCECRSTSSEVRSSEVRSSEVRLGQNLPSLIMS